jgi:hypothetical protein
LFEGQTVKQSSLSKKFSQKAGGNMLNNIQKYDIAYYNSMEILGTDKHTIHMHEIDRSIRRPMTKEEWEEWEECMKQWNIKNASIICRSGEERKFHVFQSEDEDVSPTEPDAKASHDMTNESTNGHNGGASSNATNRWTETGAISSQNMHKKRIDNHNGRTPSNTISHFWTRPSAASLCNMANININNRNREALSNGTNVFPVGMNATASRNNTTYHTSIGSNDETYVATIDVGPGYEVYIADSKTLEKIRNFPESYMSEIKRMLLLTRCKNRFYSFVGGKTITVELGLKHVGGHQITAITDVVVR